MSLLRVEEVYNRVCIEQYLQTSFIIYPAHHTRVYAFGGIDYCNMFFITDFLCCEWLRTCCRRCHSRSLEQLR